MSTLYTPPTTTTLTEAMIDSFPAIDPHVHVPGTISPQTAWELGIRNGLLTMISPKESASGKWEVINGPNHINPEDPVGSYLKLFTSKGGHGLDFDKSGNPIDLDYNYFLQLPPRGDGKERTKFDGFDAIQGTTQGHRRQPGGIQNEDDYRFVMRQYLESCKAQHMAYVEPSQNITIATVLYPDLSPQEARSKFFQLAKEMVDEFAAEGVTLRFTHCANKTAAAADSRRLDVRAAEWVDWLEEAQAQIPGVFVGLTTAGDEKREIQARGPRLMVEAYQRVRAMGMGCEGHYGEGAGVEHMMKAMELLPEDTRFAHGIQVIESEEAIAKVRERGKPLIMAPYINISLGGVIHKRDGEPHPKLQRDAEGKFILVRHDAAGKVERDAHGQPIPDPNGQPLRVEGIENHHIRRLEDHPIWELMREHHLPIGLMSDDPQQGGMDYKDQVKLLAGIGKARGGVEPVDAAVMQPLTAEELTLCNLNALQVAFCEPEVKLELTGKIIAWAEDNHIHVVHPLLDEYVRQRDETRWQKRHNDPVDKIGGEGWAASVRKDSDKDRSIR